MIPGQSMPPEDAEYLDERGRKEWSRIVEVLGPLALDVEGEQVTDYAFSLAYFLSLAELLRARGAIDVKDGKAVESLTVHLVERALRSLRREIARMGAEQPIPDTIDVHELTTLLSEN